MNDLRTAAKQALEALEDMLGWQSLAPQTIQESAKGRAAALRAALAEPTPLEDVVTHGSAWSKDGKRIDPMSVYAEPVQEPVAFAHINGTSDTKWHPPQRKPLTETSAERTLKRLGYTDCGGEFWKPPLGAPAKQLEAIMKEREQQPNKPCCLAERESCAKVCELMEQQAEGTECCKWPTPIDCAAAIRARSNP